MSDWGEALVKYAEGVEKDVLEWIYKYNGLGVHHGKLAVCVGLDRKTLRKYTKSLIRKKAVKRGPGKQGRYFYIGKK